jgi:pilus assembly protein Flp/PilA
VRKLLARFARNESGVTAIEYGLIAAFVGVVIIAGSTSLGIQLNGTFNSLATTIGSSAA